MVQKLVLQLDDSEYVAMRIAAKARRMNVAAYAKSLFFVGLTTKHPEVYNGRPNLDIQARLAFAMAGIPDIAAIADRLRCSPDRVERILSGWELLLSDFHTDATREPDGGKGGGYHLDSQNVETPVVVVQSAEAADFINASPAELVAGHEVLIPDLIENVQVVAILPDMTSTNIELESVDTATANATDSQDGGEAVNAFPASPPSDLPIAVTPRGGDEVERFETDDSNVVEPAAVDPALTAAATLPIEQPANPAYEASQYRELYRIAIPEDEPYLNELNEDDMMTLLDFAAVITDEEDGLAASTAVSRIKVTKACGCSDWATLEPTFKKFQKSGVLILGLTAFTPSAAYFQYSVTPKGARILLDALDGDD